MAGRVTYIPREQQKTFSDTLQPLLQQALSFAMNKALAAPGEARAEEKQKFEMGAPEREQAQFQQNLAAFKDLAGAKDAEFTPSLGPSGISLSPKSPTERLSEIKLQEIERRRTGAPTAPIPLPPSVQRIVQPTKDVGVQQITRDTQVQKVEQNVARVIGGQTDVPAPFVQIPDGIDEFGIPKTKTVTNPDYKLYETVKIKEINADAEVLKLGKKAGANFGRSTAMFSNLISQIKGAAEEQGGLGILQGARGGLGAKLRIPGFGRASAISGQITETSLGLNSILTGQNRVIRSVVSMIRDTLPTRFDPEDQVAAKVSQSISNSYRLVKAFEKAGLTPEVLDGMNEEELDKIDASSLISTFQLNEDEQGELERIIDEVLSAPPTKARTLEGLGKPKTIPKEISPDLKIRAIEELRRRGEL